MRLISGGQDGPLHPLPISAELADELERTAPRAATTVRMYEASLDHHFSTTQNTRHEETKHILVRKPWRPIEREAIFEQWVEPIAREYTGVIQATLHAYQTTAQDWPYTSEMEELLLRATPHFMLEVTSNHPRLWLFDMERGYVKHHVPAPQLTR